MLRLAFQGVRGRKGPFAGAFIALAVAATLVMACGALLQAGLQAGAPVERYAAAPIVIAGQQSATIGNNDYNQDSVPLFERAHLPASLVQKVAATPGVGTARADVATPADLIGRHGPVGGPTGHQTLVHPWSSAALTPYVLAQGRAPAAATDIVVDAGIARRGHLHVGQRVRLASNGPAQTMTVSGVARTTADVRRQGVLFVTAATSARLAALPGRVDAIGVIPAPGADRGALEKQLKDVIGPHARVVTGDARGEVEHLEAVEEKDAVVAIAGTFGGLALLIAMFVVSSTIGLSVMQREREVALLRAVAATPKQVRRMIRWEALLVGVVASAVGILPGAALAGVLGHALSGRGIAPEDMHVAAGVVPALVAVASSVLTALVAVAAAGRRAARVNPTRALQESSAEPRLIGPVRLLCGLIAAGGGAVLLIIAGTSHNATVVADTAAGISLALILAIAFLGPLVVRVAASLAAPVLDRRSRAEAFMAVSNMRTSARRFSSAMTPLVLTVGLSCTMVFLTTTRQHATAEQGHERVTADLVLQSDGPGIPRAAAAEVRATPGVASATGLASTTLGPSLGSTHQAVQAAIADPQALAKVLDLDVRHGSLHGLHGDAIALSEMQAAMAHASAGDHVKLVLGDGARRTVLVSAIYRRGLGFGDALLPSSMVSGHVTSPLLDTVLVRTAPGASAHAVEARLRRLAARYPGLTVGDRHDLAARADTDRETDDWLFKILAGIVFAFTAIAVVNTLMMIAVHRRRELGMLRLIGATSQQVRSMARWESAMVVALGVGLGAVVALITLIPTSAVLSGSPVPYAPAGLVVLVLGSAAALGVMGSALATRLAMRARPVEAIGLRD